MPPRRPLRSLSPKRPAALAVALLAHLGRDVVFAPLHSCGEAAIGHRGGGAVDEPAVSIARKHRADGD